MGPVWGSEISCEPRSAESKGQGTTAPPRPGQRTQGSGLSACAPLLPRHQIVLFGGMVLTRTPVRTFFPLCLRNTGCPKGWHHLPFASPSLMGGHSSLP